MLHVQFVQKRIWEFGVLVALGLAWGPVHVYAVGEERSQRGPLPPGHLHPGKSRLQITGDLGGWQLHLRKETRAGAPGARHAWQGRVFDAKKLRVVRMFVAETEDCVEPLPWRLPCLPGRKNCFLQGSALPSALAVG